MADQNANGGDENAEGAAEQDGLDPTPPDPARLPKLIFLGNMVLGVGVLALAVLSSGPSQPHDGVDVGDQIGGSLSGEGGGGKSHRQGPPAVGPMFELPEVQARLAEATEFRLIATMVIELEDEATKADLEKRTVQVRHVVRALLATKRKREVTGAAVEPLRGEIVTAINTVLPNGKAVRVWPQSWLVE